MHIVTVMCVERLKFTNVCTAVTVRLDGGNVGQISGNWLPGFDCQVNCHKVGRSRNCRRTRVLPPGEKECSTQQILIFETQTLIQTRTQGLSSSKWRYSPGWALASSTICLQVSRFLALSLHSFIPIFLRSMDTSSSHLILGLTLRLFAYSFPYNIFFWGDCGVLHSFYMPKPSYSLAFNKADSVFSLDYGF